MLVSTLLALTSLGLVQAADTVKSKDGTVEYNCPTVQTIENFYVDACERFLFLGRSCTISLTPLRSFLHRWHYSTCSHGFSSRLLPGSHGLHCRQWRVQLVLSIQRYLRESCQNNHIRAIGFCLYCSLRVQDNIIECSYIGGTGVSDRVWIRALLMSFSRV
jgi:hypothetical protein